MRGFTVEASSASRAHGRMQTETILAFSSGENDARYLGIAPEGHMRAWSSFPTPFVSLVTQAHMVRKEYTVLFFYSSTMLAEYVYWSLFF